MNTWRNKISHLTSGQIFTRFDFGASDEGTRVLAKYLDNEMALRWCLSRTVDTLRSGSAQLCWGTDIYVVCSPEWDVLGLFTTLPEALCFMAQHILKSGEITIDPLSYGVTEGEIVSILPQIPRVRERDYPIKINDTHLVLGYDGVTLLDDELDADRIDDLFDPYVTPPPRHVLYEERGRDVICEPVFNTANLMLGQVMITEAWIEKISGSKASSRDQLMSKIGAVLVAEPILWKGRKIIHKTFYCEPSMVEEVCRKAEMLAGDALTRAKIRMVKAGCEVEEVERISTLTELLRHPLITSV